jgi:hypothetical protein
VSVDFLNTLPSDPRVLSEALHETSQLSAWPALVSGSACLLPLAVERDDILLHEVLGAKAADQSVTGAILAGVDFVRLE